MNEAEFQVAKLAALLTTYVELNKLHAQPGERAHMLATSIQYVERRIKEILK